MHRGCSFCGDNGYLFREYRISPGAIEAAFRIENRHEGWPGIPHGGVGMSTFLELVDLYDGRYMLGPWRANFRLGGDSLAIGDRVSIRVAAGGDGFQGEMLKSPERRPYLRARMDRDGDALAAGETRTMEHLLRRPWKMKTSFVIPAFSERIVFSAEWKSGHSGRIFDIVETVDGDSFLLCFYGEEGSQSCAGMNMIDGERVHPGSLITILDEVMGWAAFLTAWQGGLTVDMTTSFERPLYSGDSFFCMARCTSLRGMHKRKLAGCSGVIFVKEGDVVSPVIHSTGRWLTDPSFKDNMLSYLLP